MGVIDWLLEGDPAIRWQVLRDLTDASPDEVAAERARVAHEGWGARLLALQGADGLWEGGACFPAAYTGGEGGQPWTATMHTLQTLQIFGLDPACVAARRTIPLVAELARRYLHVFGPATPEGFVEWAGIAKASGPATFDALAGSLTPVATPHGDAWILSEDEAAFRTPVGGHVAPARLIPSGDALFLLQGTDRELLVPDPDRRRELWPARVWPGAILVEGEVAGTWRRAGAVVTIHMWHRLSKSAREAVELEGRSFPLPDVQRQIRVQWAT